jgi:hypothetical protein
MEGMNLLEFTDQVLLHIMHSLSSLELSRMDRTHPRFRRRLAPVTEVQAGLPLVLHGEEWETTVTTVRRLSLVAEAARVKARAMYAGAGQQPLPRQPNESWLHLLWRQEAVVIVDRVPAVLKGESLGSGAHESLRYYGAGTVPDGWLELGHITMPLPWQHFPRGASVLVHSLAGAPQHNGKTGRIVDGRPTEAGRWRVSPDDHPSALLGVKPTNLRLNPSWKRDSVVVVQESPAVRRNTGWALVWHDFGPWKCEPGQPPYEPQYAVWMPTCEDAEFFALGVACAFGADLVEPDFHLALVHQDCLEVVPTRVDAHTAHMSRTPVWTDAGTQAAFDISFNTVSTVLRTHKNADQTRDISMLSTLSMWPTALTMVDARLDARIARESALMLPTPRLEARALSEMRWV